MVQNTYSTKAADVSVEFYNHMKAHKKYANLLSEGVVTTSIDPDFNYDLKEIWIANENEDANFRFSEVILYDQQALIVTKAEFFGMSIESGEPDLKKLYTTTDGTVQCPDFTITDNQNVGI